MENLASARLSPTFKAVQMASYGDDNAANVVFEDVYITNEFQSDISGKAVEEHRIQVTLEYPGNNQFNFKFQFTAEEGLKGNEWTRRFPNQWTAFASQKAQVPEGTPLEVWAALDKRRVLGMKASNIHTIEQVAALTDATGPIMGMDWRKIRDMAIAYLKPSEGSASVSRLTRENEDLKNRLEVMERNLQDLSHLKSVDSASVTLNDQPKRRGRKPKIQTETETL